MKLKSASFILGILLLGIYSALAFALMRTTDLLEFSSSELSKAAHSISVVQSLKNRMLAHNRNAFLYHIEKDPVHFETLRMQRLEILDYLKAAEQLISNKEESDILHAVQNDIASYLKKRDIVEEKLLTPWEKYVLVSNDLEKAITAIDRLVTVNRSKMDTLSAEIKRQKKEANLLAVILYVLAAISLVIIIIAVFFAVVYPLMEVDSAITNVSAGKSVSRVNPSGVAEIRKIAANFNAMTERLEEKRRDQLRFIASIAHDIRNPLNSISMASEILTQQVQEEDREIAMIVNRQVRNLDRLVGDLLDTTRIEAGQLDLSFTKQNVSQLVKDAVELIRTGSHLHEFKLEFLDQTLMCNCDGGRLLQVLNNLLSNACKYSPNGGTITVRAWKEDANIKVSVADQGIGIAPEDIDSIFKPFHRTKATKDTIPGIGLGLSASRRIVEAHGGSLVVESVPGKGSTFYVTVPQNTFSQQVSNDSPPPVQIQTPSMQL